MNKSDQVKKILFVSLSNIGDVILTTPTLVRLGQKYRNAKIDIIGDRHAEKIHESLGSQEEMSKAVDMGNFYRIPPDYRDLNYTKYINSKAAYKYKSQEYMSNNTKVLNIKEVKKILLKEKYVQEKLRLIK